MTQTAYPQPGGCQSCLSHPFPEGSATGCSIKAPLELLSFPAAHCSSYCRSEECSRELWGLWSQEPLPLRVALGTGGGSILPRVPVSSTFQPSVGSPLEKTKQTYIKTPQQTTTTTQKNQKPQTNQPNKTNKKPQTSAVLAVKYL